TSTAIFLSAVRPSGLKAGAHPARRRQRTPSDTSSSSTSLIRRSAPEAAPPVASTRPARLFRTSVPTTATTNTATTARITPARRRGSVSLGLYSGMTCSVVYGCKFGTSLSQPLGREKRKRRTLDDFRSQDVVHVDEADRSTLTIDDHEARDLPRLHHLECLGGEIVLADRLRLRGRDCTRAQFIDRRAVQVEATQVAVRDDAREPTPGVHDRRHTLLLLRHLHDHVAQRHRLAHDRDGLAREHQVPDTDEGAPAEGPARVKRRVVLGPEAAELEEHHREGVADLAPDQPRLAHAGHDHAASRAAEQLDGALEVRVELRDQPEDRLGLEAEDTLGQPPEVGPLHRARAAAIEVTSSRSRGRSSM